MSGLANPPSNLTAEHATGIEHLLSYDATLWPEATLGTRGMMSATHYDKTANWPKVRLAYVETADLAAPTALAANTWTDIVATQSFTVNSTAAVLHVQCIFGGLLLIAGGVQTSGAVRLVFDSAGTPINVPLSACWGPVGGRIGYSGGATWMTALAAGTHTVKVQVIATQAENFYCRPSTVPATEFARVTVIETSP